MRTRAGTSLTAFLIAIALVFSGLALEQRWSALEAFSQVVHRCWREGFGSCSAQPLPQTEQPNWTPQAIFLNNGERRTYLLRRPDGPGPRPTIVVLHGVYGNGPQTAISSGLGRFAPEHGFVGVFPSARAGLWNAFPPGKVPESVEFRAGQAGLGDDVLFLKTLFADLIRRGISDPKRIFVAGLSMGGFMALDMACRDAADLKGIAIVGSSMPEVTGGTCVPARSLAFLVINGTADKSVPYAGGAVGASRYNVWATDRTVEFFRRLDGCRANANDTELPPLHPRQRTHIVRQIWDDCTSAKVVLYRVRDGAHDFPPVGLDMPSTLIAFFDSIR